jgi:hypothetical protein
MAKVMIYLSDAELKREERGVTFVVRTADGSEKIGELKVSTGGLRWRSKDQKGKPHLAPWEKFSAWMKRQPQP